MLNLSRSSDSQMGISMDEDAENFEALAETTVFLSYFKELPDHRQAGKVTYPLDEIGKTRRHVLAMSLSPLDP
jgi:hypothetical protein